MSNDSKNKIESIINSNKVVLFMKGTKDVPLCGFSAKVVSILNHLNVDFEAFNVFDDLELKEDLKEYSNWPTFPQLYVNNKLVGGCDIISEMFESDELSKLLN